MAAPIVEIWINYPEGAKLSVAPATSTPALMFGDETEVRVYFLSSTQTPAALESGESAEIRFKEVGDYNASSVLTLSTLVQATDDSGRIYYGETITPNTNELSTLLKRGAIKSSTSALDLWGAVQITDGSGNLKTSEPFVATIRNNAFAIGESSPTVGIKANLSATTAPGVTDDEDSGYGVGSLWINTTADTAYIMADDSSGAAVWLLIGGTP